VENSSVEARALEAEASLQGDNTFMGLDDVRFSVRPRWVYPWIPKIPKQPL